MVFLSGKQYILVEKRKGCTSAPCKQHKCNSLTNLNKNTELEKSECAQPWRAKQIGTVCYLIKGLGKKVFDDKGGRFALMGH